MRKVLLVHISSSGCCNTLVSMLNNGDFGFPYCATPAFSTPAVWCRVFQSRVFSRPGGGDLQGECPTDQYIWNLKKQILFFQKYVYSYKNFTINSIVSRREYDYKNVTSLNKNYVQLNAYIVSSV